MLEAFPFKLYAFILQVAIHAANHMQDSLLVLHRFINPRVITPGGLWLFLLQSNFLGLPEPLETLKIHPQNVISKISLLVIPYESVRVLQQTSRVACDHAHDFKCIRFAKFSLVHAIISLSALGTATMFAQS